MMFHPFPNIETERLSLRQLLDTDVEEIFLLRSDKRVQKYMIRPDAQSLQDAKDFIERVNKGLKNNEWIHWVIVRKNCSRLIGTICLWNINKDQLKAEIGFELLPEFQGQGYMSEVVPIILDYGFNTMGLKIIDGEVDPNNKSSINLMKKFDFELAVDINKNIDKNGNVLNSIIYRLKKGGS